MKKVLFSLALSAAIFFIAGCSHGSLISNDNVTVAAEWPTSKAQVDSLYSTGTDLDRPMHNCQYGNYGLEIFNSQHAAALSYQGKTIFSDSADGSHYFQWMADSTRDLVVAQLIYYDGRDMGSVEKSSIFVGGKVVPGTYPGWARVNHEFPKLLLVMESESALAKNSAAPGAYSAVNPQTGEIRNYN